MVASTDRRVSVCSRVPIGLLLALFGHEQIVAEAALELALVSATTSGLGALAEMDLEEELLCETRILGMQDAMPDHQAFEVRRPCR